MKFYRDLLESSGLAQSQQLISATIAGAVTSGFLMALWITNIPALSLCLAILVLATCLEVLRAISTARGNAFEKLWPQVFDSFQNAAQSSISLSEQLGYLAEDGPIRLRSSFAQLGYDLDRGEEIQGALARFKSSVGSRHGDFLALLIELSNELGSNSMAKTWEAAASELRSEQAIFGQVLAKQGWVLGSAKISLVAPWLIALVLIQLEQNRAAFASELGALVLVLGLGLSVVAYFFVNRMAKLTMPNRIFNA